MSLKHNSDIITALSKQRSLEKREMVIQAILMMVENKEPVTFSRVMKKTGVSKRFVYNTPEIRDLIESHRPKPNQNKPLDKRDEVIETLRHQVKTLENKIKRLEKDELWQDKYKILLTKIRELEKQLETAYDWKG